MEVTLGRGVVPVDRQTTEPAGFTRPLVPAERAPIDAVERRGVGTRVPPSLSGPPQPGVCRGTPRESSPSAVPQARVADVIAAARRQGVHITPEVFRAARDVLVPTYNTDYRSCDIPMYCHAFSIAMRDQLRSSFPNAKVDMLELVADDPTSGINHYVVRADFGHGPVILDATADQFEILAGRSRIGPQLRSEGDYMSFIRARGYGSPRVVTGDET